MIWSISWKNVWRNKLRSGVVIAAFALGIFGGIFAIAIFNGWIDQRVDLAIGNEASHIQIHNPKFLENNELKYVIEDYPALLDSTRTIPEVKGVSPRIKIQGMATTSGNATGIIINGIHPPMERSVSGIPESLPENGGEYFEEEDAKEIVIGEKMAKVLKLVHYEINREDMEAMKNSDRLEDVVPMIDSLQDRYYRLETDLDNVLIDILGKQKFQRLGFYIKEHAIKYKLRRKIVLSFSALDGNLAYDAFRVVGVYKSGNTSFDALNAYVRMPQIAETAGISKGNAHEIAVLLTSSQYDDQVAGQISEMVPEMKVRTWKEVMPEAAIYSSMMNFYLLIFMGIILIALGFGIVNTMLMAVLERIKELGMLMAIGMNKVRVFFMIMLETIFLGLTGSVIGMAIASGLIYLTARNGLDLRGLYQEGFEALGFSALVYPEIGWFEFFQVTLLVVLTGVLASIYPARKALKMDPADALRIDM